MSALLGVWEGPDSVLVLLDHGGAIRVWQRGVLDGRALEQSVVFPLDGTEVQVGGVGMRARLTDDALHIEARVAGEALQLCRRLEGEQLIETLNGGDTVVYGRSSTKQVLVYRRDLKMRKGKIAAQCAHGSMAVFFRRDRRPPGALEIPLDGAMEHWSRARFAKIVLSVEGEEDLLRIHQACLDAGIPTAVITDAGKTEFHGVPTKTVVAVGPAALAEIDRITGPDGVVACKLA